MIVNCVMIHRKQNMKALSKMILYSLKFNGSERHLKNIQKNNCSAFNFYPVNVIF